MKKILITVISIILPFLVFGQNYNPFVAQGVVSPSPLYDVASNGTGSVSFVVGNSGDDPLPLVTNQEMLLVLTLSRGLPDNANPLAAISGSFAGYFDWLYDPISKTYLGTQNQLIPDALNGGVGTISVAYKVTSNSPSVSPQNGFNVNITPPPYTNGINSLNDDQVSSYTWTVPKFTPNPDFAVTPVGVQVTGNLGTNDNPLSGGTYSNPPANPSNPSPCAPIVATNGTFTFVCNTPGEYIFYVPSCEPSPLSACYNVPLEITVFDPASPTNPPAANPDYATTTQDNSVTITPKANDLCQNGPSCSLGSPTLITSPTIAGATAIVNPDGTVTYTPAPGYVGKDSVMYAVCDNQTPVAKCDSEYIYITVLPLTNVNTTNADDDFTQTPFNVAVSGTVKTNDTDPQGNTQTVTAQTTTIAPKGTLVLTTAGTYTFTPISGFSGMVDFPYTTCDNGSPQACATATLHILVLPKAAVLTPDFGTTQVNVPLNGNVTTNDVPTPGSTYSNPPANPSNPSPCAPVVASTGAYTFTCATPGEYTFYVPVCEPSPSQVCTSVPLVITVLDPTTSTNAPEANPDNAITFVNVPVTTVVKSNDICQNGPGCTLSNPTIVSNPSVSGSSAVVNPNGTITYTPAPGYVGKDSLTYQVCDNQTPTAKCDTDWVYITVLPTGSPNVTVANDDYGQSLDGTPVTGNVKLNDTDPEGHVQTVTSQTTTIAGKGTLVLGANGNYTFTPVTGFSGPVDYPYTTCDNGSPIACATATIHILYSNLNTNTVVADTACDTYTWAVNGMTYTTSGTYTATSINGAGYTNTNTLNLYIKISTTASSSATACDTYTWAANGVTYTASGSYTKTSLNAAGCTHTDTLHLTINHSTTAASSATACNTYTWAANGVTYTASGSYTATSLNAAGCTHTDTLHLTINTSTTSTSSATACDSYTWAANGTTYTASGTYTATSLNASGCVNTETLNLTINSSTTTTTNATACDTYTWAANGLTYTASGTYTFTSLNAAGCTNTATLNLTINASTTSTSSATACDTYTWAANGTTYTASGTYTATSLNAAGCTHTSTLNLTINASTTSTSSATACDTYTWAANGTTYTASGTYTATSLNAAGCTHTSTLNLTINASTTSSASASACDTYTWAANGVTYTASGTYTFTSLNAAGCTHTSTLNLTINASSTSSSTVTACGSYTWADNGTTYTASGTYTATALNAAGCTNTATLNLTINTTSTTTLTTTACDTYTWADNGTTYTASGTYTHTTLNASGCTNTATLNLTVNASTTSSTTATACDTYTWADNGVTYTASGTYTYTSLNAAGCTNTATLNLTVNASTTSSSSATACDTYTWSANNTSYTASGTYTSTSLNAAGCTHTSTLNLTINTSTTSTSTITACDTYTWAANGTTYTASGTYTATSLNAAGCTHTATLNLTINASTTSSASATACDTYTWAANTVTYTASGTYTFTSLNAAGCTNTATLNLTINASTTSSASATACDTYTWAANGTTYTASGTYTATSLNAAGCTHTSTLNLTINSSSTSTSSATACDTYTWAVNGTTYTASGTYTATSLNASGCTNTATLNLTINASTTSTSNATSCDTYTWAANGTTYTASGTYTHTSLNAAGCTNTATLNLTINASSASSATATACDTYTWAANGTTYTASGTYTATSLNAAGCTHTSTLNLTINASTTSSASATACDTYTWALNGSTYTASGTYTATSLNAAGCTHTTTLNLTINSSTSTMTPAVACDTYTWAVNNTTYTTSGTYTSTSVNAAGCTHTNTLNLVINYSTTNGNLTTTAYNSYFWNGTTYTASGTYTHTSLNVMGCPNVATLILTILTLPTLNPDFGVAQLGTPITGNLNTNDLPTPGSTYTNPPANPNNPSPCAPVVASNGTYTFICSTPGEYTFFIPVCPPPPLTTCTDVPLVITVLDPTATTNPPLANPDLATTMVNVPVTVYVKANDICTNGPSCTLSNPTVITGPAVSGATATLNIDGTVTYNPAPGFVGKDSLKYAVCDNQLPLSKCDSEWVYITVLPLTNPNTTNATDDYGQTPFNTPANGTVKTNDTDPEGNTQSITPQSVTVPGKGTLNLTATGTYTFTPVTGFTGSVDFPYTTCDNGSPQACATATLHLLVAHNVPDLTPNITITPNIFQGVTQFNVTVRVTELNSVTTNGLITVRIPKDNRVSFTYNPASFIIGFTPVSNSTWTYNGSNPFFHVFTRSASITGGSFSTFGFIASFNPLNTDGKYTMTSTISSGSGGESRTNNNTDSELADYFHN